MAETDLLRAQVEQILGWCEELGIARSDLAREAGMPPSTINKPVKAVELQDWSIRASPIKATTMRRLQSTAERIAQERSRSLATQPRAAPIDPRPGFIEVGDTEFAAIPRYDAALSAGPGSIVQDSEPLGYHLVEAQWLRGLSRATPQHLGVVRVDGDSMETTLFNGDWVLIDRTQQSLSREGIYALRVADRCWVKRLSINLRDKLVRIISDNERYPMQEMVEEELELLGRVIWIVGRKV